MHIVLDIKRERANQVLLVGRNRHNRIDAPSQMQFEAELIFDRVTGRCLKSRNGDFRNLKDR